jgi:hypothetical protein
VVLPGTESGTVKADRRGTGEDGANSPPPLGPNSCPIMLGFFIPNGLRQQVHPEAHVLTRQSREV